jgi:hypothetical protein
MIPEDPEWHPWHTPWGAPVNLFIIRRSLDRFILNNFVSEQLIFIDSDFQEVVISAFFHKYDQSEANPLPVLTSFINSFMLQDGFTSRMIHYKRRPAVTEEQRQNWT